MTTTDESIEQVRERAALYALGALPREEARAVKARLAAGDARYQAEVAAFRRVADALAYAAQPQSPRPEMRDRVRARIAADHGAVVDTQGLRFVRSGRLGWEPGAVPGLEIKVLGTDEPRGRATLLARMAPGCVYPAHRHSDCEETYLIEGDLQVNGVLMRPGDYCSAGADSIHDGISTVGGCVFVVTAGLHDELLPF